MAVVGEIENWNERFGVVLKGGGGGGGLGGWLVWLGGREVGGRFRARKGVNDKGGAEGKDL